MGTTICRKAGKKQGPRPAKPTRAGPLTQQEKDEHIRYVKRLDPELYELDERKEEAVRKPESKSKTIAPETMTVPAGSRYMISVDSVTGTETYFSQKEPKPFGAGYKFDLGGTEFTVSGSVRIIRLQKD